MKTINVSLAVAVIIWVAMVVERVVYMVRFEYKARKAKKLPNPDFFNTRTRLFRRSYWQRINNIETK